LARYSPGFWWTGARFIDPRSADTVRVAKIDAQFNAVLDAVAAAVQRCRTSRGQLPWALLDSQQLTEGSERLSCCAAPVQHIGSNLGMLRI
jgi:hypothetical protein